MEPAYPLGHFLGHINTHTAVPNLQLCNLWVWTQNWNIWTILDSLDTLDDFGLLKFDWFRWTDFSIVALESPGIWIGHPEGATWTWNASHRRGHCIKHHGTENSCIIMSNRKIILQLGPNFLGLLVAGALENSTAQVLTGIYTATLEPSFSWGPKTSHGWLSFSPLKDATPTSLFE